MPIAACFIGRIALALDADLAQEAVSKLQQYIQLRTSSRSAAPEALTSDELDAAARMYALEVCNMLSSLNLHVYRQQNKSAGHCLQSNSRRLHGVLAASGGSMHPKHHETSCRRWVRLQSSPTGAAAGTSHAGRTLSKA